MPFFHALLRAAFCAIAALALALASACNCYTPHAGDLQPPAPPLPPAALPSAWDWRSVNGTNYCAQVHNQQNPSVCGSCWADAATGALSDRFAIATGNALRVSLSTQVFLNFNANTSGGDCYNGDHLRALQFVFEYGIVDDSCAPFIGLQLQVWKRRCPGIISSPNDVFTFDCLLFLSVSRHPARL